MRRQTLLGVIAGLSVAALGATPAAAAPRAEPLDAYTATVTKAQLEVLRESGVDLHEAGAKPFATARVPLVLTRSQAKALERRGIRPRLLRRGGRTSSERSRLQGGDDGYNVYNVYRPYSGPGGIAEELRALAARYPRIAQLRRIGTSVQGKPILAVKVTRNARSRRDGSRPATLFSATQHAREWLATETGRRLLRYVLEGYATNPTVKRLVDTRELWFVPVANPDGYDYTFTPGNRLWRKNLRDNDGDGVIEAGVDGVDPNRNFATKWGYDNEGSSPDPGSETYRGPGPNSEPETRAMDGLLRRVRFRMQINYHTAAELLLYPYGFQVDTRTDDDPIFEALTGTDGPDPSTTTDDDSAVPGYDPDLGAELYITNGETTDHAYSRYGTLAWTPELDTAQSAGVTGVSVFEFPDDEAKVQAAFEKNIPFALNVAASAGDPDDPVQVLRTDVAPYEVKDTPDFQVDAFAVSFGSPQAVEANVKRSLGRVRMHYRVDGGPWRVTTARSGHRAERYDRERGRYYHKVRGVVRNTDAGDRVEVFFRAGGRDSEHFTYTVEYDGPAQVLVLAAEDSTGNSPGPPYAGPRYLDADVAALRAAGLEPVVWDVDARGRQAPHPLAILRHFRAVLWYTGDDLIVREPTQGPGTSSKLQHEEQLAVRQYLNEGGRLLYTGRNRGYANFNSFGLYYFFEPGDTAPIPPTDDFHQYWLGEYTQTVAGVDNSLFAGAPVTSVGVPFSFGTLTPDAGPEGANAPSEYLTTSSFLDPDQFPLFTSLANSKYAPVGPPRNEPVEGAWQAFASSTAGTWKRLTRTIDVPAGTTTLDFRTAYALEQDYDFGLVEIHTVGADDWTTLPDRNGHTSQTLGSCEIEWRSLHPFLDRYQTYTPPATPEASATCTPTGTTGQWHGLTGNSPGWTDVSYDLSAYAGRTVEVSISYVTDFAIESNGFQIDDVRLITDGTTTALTGFETDLGGFVAAPAPEGSAATPPGTEWQRAQELDFPGDEAAGVTTRDTVTLGFGLEQVPEAARNDIVGQAMAYLLRSDDDAPAVPESGQPGTTGTP